ncbi:helix-turn-helix domain-containing protein [Nocardia sp. XZ_19_369]|uniref:helix-turn-helix domain-containing protein n=1 Tax=Nocardia sp. XZ_19_369 TaxID=2769487 RepID=UPI00188F3060|nr:helix-turn-helix domain-containing protein [Nocardia sp. XZ_19_369]
MEIDRWTGVEVKILREYGLNWTQKTFADRTGWHINTISKWERRGGTITLKGVCAQSMDKLLDNLDSLHRQRFENALFQAVRLSNPLHSADSPHAVCPSTNGTGLLSELDTLRLAVDQTLSKCTVAPARVDLIEERIAERVRAYTTIPPGAALAAIAPDLLEVQAIAAERQTAAIQSQLSEASAVLSLLTADALMKLGEIERANYWYSTARLAADDSPNLKLQASVRAQHAMLPYYYGHTEKTVALARSAQDLLPNVACDATALAAAAEARALARLGDDRGAETAMTRAQRLTEALDETSDEAFRFNTKRLLLYLSGTLTYMGRIARARRVQDEALQLYRSNPSVVIDPALIQLDAAVGYAMEGSADDGCQLAVTVVDSLPPGHRTRLVVARATDVLDALPAKSRQITAASSLRELVEAEMDFQ